MTIAKTIDLTRQQDVLRGVLFGAVDDDLTDLIWADPSVPRPARPYGSIRIDTGPAMDGALKEYHSTRAAPQDATATVGAVSAGDLLTLRLNGVAYRYAVLGGDTPTIVAAALVALVEADAEATVSAANVGPVITISPDFTGAIYAVDAFPDLQWTIVENATTDDVTDIRARKRMTMSVDVFQKAHVTIDQKASASMMADRMRTILDAPSAIAAFADARVAATAISPVLNVSSRDNGGEMEGHASFDIDFHVASLVTFPTDTIESVDGIEIDISGNLITFTVPTP